MSWNDAMKWLAGAILLGVWAGAAYLKLTSVEPVISFISMTLGFLARHIITMEPPAPPTQVPVASFPSPVILPNGDQRPHLYVPGREGGSFHVLIAIGVALLAFGAYWILIYFGVVR